MSHSYCTLDELGDGPGFRKVRHALGVTAFGVNAIVYPPGFEGFRHYHDLQDELVLLVVGGKGGYVECDGHLVDPGDAERRAAFGRS